MKGCAVALVVREIQVKTTRQNHYTPTRVLKLKRLTSCLNSLLGEDSERLEHSCIASGNVKCHSHFGEQFDSVCLWD